jgi:ProQ/FINO family
MSEIKIDIDLSKTSGVSPPGPREIYVTPEKNIEYRAAVKAYRASHAMPEKLEDIEDLEAYRVYRKSWDVYCEGLEAVRQQVLGEQYQPGGSWTVCVERTPAQIEQAKNVIYLEPEEYKAYRSAIDAFTLANQDAVRNRSDIEDFKARKDELKRRLLGDLYVERVRVRCTVHSEQRPEKPIFANLGIPRKFAPEQASREQQEFRGDVNACREWLVTTFPAAFFRNSQKRVALSHHIVGEILARFNMTVRERDVLRLAVNAYRNSRGYGEAVVPGAERINLSGKTIGYVVADDPDFMFLSERRARELAA